jgi:heterodisulfide reductase subunit B
MGTTHMERSVHVYVLRQYNPHYYGDDEAVAYYASKRKADAKAVELSARQAKEEEMDWITNPCECGYRQCDRRDRFFTSWYVDKIDLTELSMRRLMEIELADADED